ncbi:MAG TPA: thioesterase family protein [Phycisphaerae bacterium]|nr:thioesterase family protein [Phycisphaerae bacterium]
MPAEFVYRRRVQFAETDMAGVMHFSNYLRLMEECEHAFWRSLGLSVHACPTVGGMVISWPRVAVRCEYQSPARFEDDLDLSLRLERLGTRSLEFTVTFSRGGQRLATASATTVCCRLNGERFEPVEIPADIRARLSGLVADRQASGE